MADLLCETGLARALCRNGRDSQLLLEDKGREREGEGGSGRKREGGELEEWRGGGGGEKGARQTEQTVHRGRGS